MTQHRCNRKDLAERRRRALRCTSPDSRRGDCPPGRRGLFCRFAATSSRSATHGDAWNPPVSTYGPSQKICNVGQVANLREMRQIGNLPHNGMSHFNSDGPYYVPMHRILHHKGGGKDVRNQGSVLLLGNSRYRWKEGLVHSIALTAQTVFQVALRTVNADCTQGPAMVAYEDGGRTISHTPVARWERRGSMSRLTIFGDDIFARTGNGKLKSRIATLFPATGTLVTLPGIHFTQRTFYLDWLESQRKEDGLPALSKEERSLAWWGGAST